MNNPRIDIVEHLRAEGSYHLTTFLNEAADEIVRLRKALEEIAEGKGTFSTDRYQHACNTIADMKQLARDALGVVGKARE